MEREVEKVIRKVDDSELSELLEKGSLLPGRLVRFLRDETGRFITRVVYHEDNGTDEPDEIHHERFKWMPVDPIYGD